jgi:beta-galactosidase
MSTTLRTCINLDSFLSGKHLAMAPLNLEDNDMLSESNSVNENIENDNYKYDSICGAIGWCFVDYYTHNDFGSGDHICPHGVFDMYRNPKYASSIYASQQDKFPVLEVLSNMKPGDFEESSLMDVYVTTNGDYVKLFKNDEYVGTFKPNTKKYRHLPHPLILIDDVVGETFKDERFKQKDRIKLSKLLSYIAFHGYTKLNLRQKLSIGLLMVKYHLSYSELVDLYNTHIAAWGGKAKTYKFVAYKDNKPMLEKTLGPSKDYHLSLKTSKNTLINEDTYDVSRVVIRYVDDYDNLLNYANKPIILKTTGPIEIIGPKVVSLLGGQISIYVRSLNKKGKATLFVECEDKCESLTFEVK